MYTNFRCWRFFSEIRE
uniref:Uncharacterized protein n=1 Tax=Rhizophora mucronata TaxID=61149 RepID=A0A2P2QIV5_RHIMU